MRGFYAEVEPSGSGGGLPQGAECARETLTFPPSVSIILPPTGSGSQLNHAPLLHTDLVFTCRLIIVDSANYGRATRIRVSGGGPR